MKKTFLASLLFLVMLLSAAMILPASAENIVLDTVTVNAVKGERFYFDEESGVDFGTTFKEQTDMDKPHHVIVTMAKELGALFNTNGNSIADKSIDFTDLIGGFYLSEQTGTDLLLIKLFTNDSEYILYQLTVNILASNSENVTYTVKGDETVKLSEADFNSASLVATGNTLGTVSFTLPSASVGVLMNGSKAVGSNDVFTYGGKPSLSDLTFVPASSFRGIADIPFSATDSNGLRFTSVLRIAKDSLNEITYTVDPNGFVLFDREDFDNYCKVLLGEDLHRVKFKLPDSKYGTLAYGLTSHSKYEALVDVEENYYYSQYPYAGLVGFMPKTTFTGSCEIKFTVYSVSGKTMNGTLTVVGKAPEKITYETTSGKGVSFTDDPFSKISQSYFGRELSYVQFKIPPIEKGYLTYVFNTKTPVTVLSTNKYYPNKAFFLQYVTFTPKESFSGVCELTYTAYTEYGSFSGVIEITVKPTAETTKAPETTAKPTEPTVPAAVSEKKDKSAYFTDVGASYSWGAGAVDYLFEKKIVNGVTSTTFSPSASIKRGDFILMLVRAYDLKENFTENFSDVPASSYYYTAIGIAKAMGIAQGQGDGKFNPDGSLSRQDALVLVARTLEKLGVTLSASQKVSFSDGKEVASYAESAVSLLANAGIVKGDNNNNINPKTNLSRMEMAVILFRVLNAGK